MFIKETKAKRKSGRVVTYLQLVTTYWDKEKKTPRHKVLCNLGRRDQIDNNQLRNLVEKLSSYLDEPIASPNDLLKIGRTLEFGIPYLVEQVWKQLKCPQFFREQLAFRRYEKPLHQAILGLVINRCQQPYSKRSAEKWLNEEVYFPLADELKLHHYYRAMDFLLACDTELEMALYDHYSQLYDRKPELVFYDTTSSYFEGEGGDDAQLRQYGYSRDHRPDRKQILLGLLVDPDGLPLASDVFAGNTPDVSTVKRMVNKLSRLGISRCIFVADSGNVSAENLSTLAEAELDTLVGTKMRQLKEVNQQVLSKRGRFTELDSGLGVKEVSFDGYRYIVVKNPKQARKDAAVRSQIVSRLEELLEKISTGDASVCEIQHPLMKRFVRKQKNGYIKLNATKVREDERYDGKYVLRTTSNLGVSDAVSAYKTLLRIEQGFDTIKNVLEIRPIFHRLDERITSHVKLCVLAYFVARHVEIKTGKSWSDVARCFRQMHLVELITSAGTVLRRTDLSADQKAILKALSIPRPKEIQKVHLNS